MTEVVVQFTWPSDASSVACKSVEKGSLLKMLTARKAEAATRKPEESSEEHVGRLYRYFNQGKGFPETEFRPDVLQPFSTRPIAAKQTAALPKAFEAKNTPLSCTVPETTGATTQAAMNPPTSSAKLPPLPKHASKEVRDQAGGEILRGL
ncbi:MAG: hypothetical protein WBC04_04105 [Candidatus Acidiferrales bacterium]